MRADERAGAPAPCLTPASAAPGRERSAREAGRLAAFFDSDLLHSFLRSKLVVAGRAADGG